VQFLFLDCFAVNKKNIALPRSKPAADQVPAKECCVYGCYQQGSLIDPIKMLWCSILHNKNKKITAAVLKHIANHELSEKKYLITGLNSLSLPQH